MARVPFVEYDEASAGVQGVYDAQQEVMSRTSNNLKLLANAPHLLPFHLPLIFAVKFPGTGDLGEDLKVAIVLRVSALNACDYCVVHNTQFGASSGTGSEKMAAVQSDDWRERTDLFDDREIAALTWAERVATNQARQDIAVFDEVSRHFTPGEIVEITYISAHRTMMNLLQEALWNDLEPPGTPDQTADMPDGYLLKYAEQVLPELLKEIEAARSERLRSQ
ncbi:MAG: hypothetical protein GEU73_13635 [Chloroflexi bacterium]|nr:hypothetical protein [Chloroflexota bacterium]